MNPPDVENVAHVMEQWLESLNREQRITLALEVLSSVEYRPGTVAQQKVDNARWALEVCQMVEG